MTTKNIRYQKIRNLILECATRKNGIALAIEKLNDNGFTAPCGRKRYWKIHQVQSILKGEMYGIENIGVATTITKHQHKAMKKSGRRNAEFLREAIKEKLLKEGLL